VYPLEIKGGQSFGAQVGAKWITSETDKQLLKESVKVAGTKQLTPQQ